MVYYQGIPAEFESLILPGCSQYCPIEKFKEITKKILPSKVFETCYGPPLNSKLVPANKLPIDWMYERFEDIFDMQ